MNNGELMTVKEVAKCLNVKTGRVRSAIFNKKIPRLETGSLARFGEGGLEACVEENVEQWLAGSAGGVAVARRASTSRSRLVDLKQGLGVVFAPVAFGRFFDIRIQDARPCFSPTLRRQKHGKD